MSPLVSVIVPNFNHAGFLGERLESIIDQTFRDFEIILLDDASTDGSRELLKQYIDHPKVSHLIINEQNSGSPFAQWRKGVALARGEYIWIAESDDKADPEFLNILLAMIDDDPEIVLAYCRSMRIDENGRSRGENTWSDELDPVHWRRDYIATGNEEIENYLVYRNTIVNASAVLFRKERFEGVVKDLNIEAMSYCGDWMLWTGMLKGHKLAFTAKALNYFRAHSGTSRSGKTLERELQRYLEYFEVIKYACDTAGIPLEYDMRYKWIVDSWLGRRSLWRQDPVKYFMPGFPASFRTAFYREYGNLVLRRIKERFLLK